MARLFYVMEQNVTDQKIIYLSCYVPYNKMTMKKMLKSYLHVLLIN